MLKERSQKFDHENLDAYKIAIDFVVLVDQIVQILPKGKGYLVDQLQRAGTSVPLNVAEGAGEYSPSEKARFYRMAKRSATECAGILEICQRLKLIEDHLYFEARMLLLRLVAMLIKMAQIGTK